MWDSANCEPVGGRPNMLDRPDGGANVPFGLEDEAEEEAKVAL